MEKKFHTTYLYDERFKLLVMSQERDLRVTVDSWLGMLNILDVWAKRPIKYILRKKPGQEIALALFRVYLYIKNLSASAYCTLHPNRLLKKNSRAGHVQRKDD